MSILPLLKLLLIARPLNFNSKLCEMAWKSLLFVLCTWSPWVMANSQDRFTDKYGNHHYAPDLLYPDGSWRHYLQDTDNTGDFRPLDSAEDQEEIVPIPTRKRDMVKNVGKKINQGFQKWRTNISPTISRYLPKKKTKRVSIWEMINGSRYSLSDYNKAMDMLRVSTDDVNKELQPKQWRYVAKDLVHLANKNMDVHDGYFYDRNPVANLMRHGSYDMAISLFERLYFIEGRPLPTPTGDITWRVVRSDMLYYLVDSGNIQNLGAVLKLLPIIPSDHSVFLGLAFTAFIQDDVEIGTIIISQLLCQHVHREVHSTCEFLKKPPSEHSKGMLHYYWINFPEKYLSFNKNKPDVYPIRKDLSAYN
ncbi:hypothetical protein IWQ62_001419 [Dispira parvispora]|uniref:Uncharacterized protein n=1 Tax=Dispira parvispora TaxID=1520584 RepID=A0A9W8E4Y8_9FUNG|nr:hypothetical protein IWQ62_001419 [Dispira parvispora]